MSSSERVQEVLWAVSSTVEEGGRDAIVRVQLVLAILTHALSECTCPELLCQSILCFLNFGKCSCCSVLCVACALGQAREMVHCLGVVASCPGAHDWSVLHAQSFIPSSASLGGFEFLFLRAAVLSVPQTA